MRDNYISVDQARYATSIVAKCQDADADANADADTDADADADCRC